MADRINFVTDERVPVDELWAVIPGPIVLYVGPDNRLHVERDSRVVAKITGLGARPADRGSEETK